MPTDPRVYGPSKEICWYTFGRLNVSLWPQRAWAFGIHGWWSNPHCCDFCLWLGPLEIMVAPRD